jgi:hypothetical protein
LADRMKMAIAVIAAVSCQSRSFGCRMDQTNPMYDSARGDDSWGNGMWRGNPIYEETR